MDRGFYHLPDAGNDRHHRDVDVSAGHGKHTVAADADQAVGELHDKSGSSRLTILAAQDPQCRISSGSETGF